MAAPFTDKPNPFTELSSEQPAADNVAVASGGPSAGIRAGEVMPGDLAGYVFPGTELVGRSADVDVTPSSMSEGAESSSTATTAHDSPIMATVAAAAGADNETRAREGLREGGDSGGGLASVAQEEGFQPVRGGVAAAERAAEMRGVGVPPTHVGGSSGESGGGGGGGYSQESGRVPEMTGGGEGGGGGGSTMSSMVKGMAGLVTGTRVGEPGGRDTSDTA